MANDLVVQLGAKLDQFAKDMDQAGNMADDAVSRIESSFASLNPTMGGFAPLGTAAAGVTGAVGVLLTALAHVNSEMADLQRNAEFVGVTAERFQRIQFAAGQGGVSSSESVTDLRKVASLLSDAKENENSLTRLLEANNIKYKDRNGHVITLNQLLGIAGGLLNKFDSMPEKVKAAQMLGLSEQWVQSLRNGSAAFEDIASGADAAGAVIDNATVAKAALFDEAWRKSTAQLGAQFKSVATDIGGWLDDLIDKASKIADEAARSQGAAAGSGQEKFNAWADALSILLKDFIGTAQQADQVSASIERIKTSGNGDPAVVAGLELIRAKAELAEKILHALQVQQSKIDFPNGVPLPGARPASANDPNPNAAKLPVRKAGADSVDAFDRATESITKHTARTEADALAQGKGAEATAALRAETQLPAAAQQAGIPVTQKVKDQIQDLAQDAGEAAEALAKAKVASDTDFGLKSAFLTPQDLAIAQQLKSIYGNDIPAALSSTQAAGLRAVDTLRTISQVGQDINRSFLVDFTTQIRNGASAMDALRTAGVNALGKIADKLASMAADQLWQSARGGSGWLGGIIGSLFKVGGGAAVGGTGLSLTATGGMYASGTDFAKGGLSLVGENGPELLNIPRGAQVIPNDVLRNGGAVGSISAPINISIDARGADKDGLAVVAAQVAQLKAELPMRVVAAVTSAKKKRQLA
jgi:hypothetical protein